MDKKFLNININDLRGSGLIETAAGLVILILMWQMMGVVIKGFQVPYMPLKGNYVPTNGGIQNQINHPKNSGKLTFRMSKQISHTNDPIQTQMSSFLKDGKFSMQKCYKEVQRRAENIGSKNFHCPIQRFETLATENGIFSNKKAREAISILKGKMRGYYENARKVDYGRKRFKRVPERYKYTLFK